MDDDVRIRVLVLVVLAAVGVTLAGIGVALDTEDVITDDRMAEVSIAGTDVTVSSSDGEVVLSENVSETSDIEITEEKGGITVMEQEEDRFTQTERERAVEIARNNTTVESYLETVENPNFSVEPVKKLDAEESEVLEVATVTSDVNGTNATISSEETVRIVNVTTEESDDAVRIDREQSYVEERAVVWIDHPGRERHRYSVKVDLMNGTVVDITDWDDP